MRISEIKLNPTDIDHLAILKKTKFAKDELFQLTDKIIHGDFLEFVRKLPNDTFDLIIADPPYNLGKNFGTTKIWTDFKKWLNWCKIWLIECKRVLKPTGSLFLFGIHHYICYLQVYLYEIEMKYRRQIIWYYENSFSTYSRAPRAMYESILWFSKSDDYTYRKIREPYMSKERLRSKIIKKGKVWKPNPEGRHGGDVWKIPILAGKRFEKERVDHPTQKPLKLCNKIIKHFSEINDLVLIPFAGSGSECIACKMQNRKFIATELNLNYIKLAKKRMKSLLLF